MNTKTYRCMVFPLILILKQWFLKRFFVLRLCGIHKTVDFVCILAVSCNSDVFIRFCSIDNSLSEVCCDDDLSLGVCCVDDDFFGSYTCNISCSFSLSSTFPLNCGCNVSGLLLTV